jgi:exodeoxyribonuclease VII large subunit
VPTLAAVGHETDLSLAELAADRRASTPSNAAELLVPDRRHVLSALQADRRQLTELAESRLRVAARELERTTVATNDQLGRYLATAQMGIANRRQLLAALDPAAILRRGYAIVRHDGRAVRTTKRLASGAIVDVQLVDGRFRATVTDPKAGGNPKYA